MTEDRPLRRGRVSIVTTSILGLTVGAHGASAQEATREFVYGSVLGDIQQATTANPGRTHVTGNLGAASADYFRGRFDGVPSDLGEIAIGPDLSAMFEIWRDQGGPIRNLTLSLGTQNNLADQVEPTDSSVEKWYESNNFAALTARLGSDWLAQATYTIYTSPNDIAGTGYELALAGAYRGQNILGSLKPQLKLAKPTDRGGVYAELVAGPGFTLFEDGAYPLSLSAPLTLGAGFNDYYGSGTGTSIYAALGLKGSVPLAFMPSDFGSWTFSAGVDLIVRDDDIKDVGDPFDDAGNFVPIGTVAISFVY